MGRPRGWPATAAGSAGRATRHPCRGFVQLGVHDEHGSRASRREEEGGGGCSKPTKPFPPAETLRCQFLESAVNSKSAFHVGCKLQKPHSGVVHIPSTGLRLRSTLKEPVSHNYTHAKQCAECTDKIAQRPPTPRRRRILRSHLFISIRPMPTTRMPTPTAAPTMMTPCSVEVKDGVGYDRV